MRNPEHLPRDGEGGTLSIEAAREYPSTVQPASFVARVKQGIWTIRPSEEFLHDERHRGRHPLVVQSSRALTCDTHHETRCQQHKGKPEQCSKSAQNV